MFLSPNIEKKLEFQAPIVALFLFMLTACGGGGGGNIMPVQESRLVFGTVSNQRVEVAFGDFISLTHKANANGANRVRYLSTDHVVASVNPVSGEVHINSPGTTTIIANAEGARQESYELVVNEPRKKGLLFPGTILNVTTGDGPFYNWVPESSASFSRLEYSSSNASVASVDPDTGKLTIIGEGDADITATLPATNTDLEMHSSYRVRVFNHGDIVSRVVTNDFRNKRIQVETSYTSGYTETENVWIGAAEQFSLCLEKNIRASSFVLVRHLRTSDNRLFTDRCIETTGVIPDMRRGGDQHLWDEVFLGDVGFAPVYLHNPGQITDTRDEFSRNGITDRVTTVNYESGRIETIVTQSFREDQTFYDYNGDGDRNDDVRISEVYWDGRLNTRALVINGQSLPVQSGNVPTRIDMPSEHPNFLKFHGDVSRVRVHVQESESEGQYYVKIDTIVPSVELLIFGVSNDGQYTEFRSDYFDRTVLVDTKKSKALAIYVMNGDRFLTPLPSHPNFQLGYELKGQFILSMVKGALDENLRIIEAASLREFTEYYKSLIIRYTSIFEASHYAGGKVFLAGYDPYNSRVAIHEAAHGYHDSILPDGFDNQVVQDLYNLVSHDTSSRYGDEDNIYWRKNKYEFFAELLTTYIYLSADENDAFALSQVDSNFYYTYAKPYFDRLFGIY